jgi:general stress protein 26
MDLAAEHHRIRKCLQRSEVAMFVTFDGGDAHSGRPMLPLWLQNDPHIYFLTHRHSRKVAQGGVQPQVALTVVSGRCYFIVLGLAYTSHDPALIRRLWRPSYRAWFPEGTDDRGSDGHQQSELLGTAEKPGSPVVASGESSRHSSSGRDSHEDDRSMVNELGLLRGRHGARPQLVSRPST